MRISTEQEFLISAGKAECCEQPAEQSRSNCASTPDPLVATKAVSAMELLLIRTQVWDWPGVASPSEPFRTLPSASRVADIVIAAGLLIVLLPVMAFIAIIMKLSDRGPVLFSHRRVGLGGKPFNCLKYRTMCVDADQRLAGLFAQDEQLLREWTKTQKLLCDPRITRPGRILRNTSLDELPQLINVLRGEMSLVGPRPIVADELRRYGRYAALYASVRPGLTGLWQVTRSAGTSYRRRVATDVYYVRNRSLAFDFRILAATIPAVLVGNG